MSNESTFTFRKAARDAIDDVERGSDGSDRQLAKDAARTLACAEDRAIFNGYREGGIQGLRDGTSNSSWPCPPMSAPTLTHRPAPQPSSPRRRQRAYSVIRGARAYTELAETSDLLGLPCR